MEIKKVISSNVNLNRVVINSKMNTADYEQLSTAKGVIENFLKDKNFNIKISDCSSELGANIGDWFEVEASRPRVRSIKRFKKTPETNLIQKVYTTVANFLDDKCFSQDK